MMTWHLGMRMRVLRVHRVFVCARYCVMMREKSEEGRDEGGKCYVEVKNLTPTPASELMISARPLRSSSCRAFMMMRWSTP